MNRTLRRPMFRMGGSAGEGITSGLAPRQGYNIGLSVKPINFPGTQAEWEAQQKMLKEKKIGPYSPLRAKKNKQTVVPGNTGSTGSSFVGGGTGTNTQSIIDKAKAHQSILDAVYPRTPRRDTSFNDFLINTGLDLISRPKGGNIFQQVATSAKDPYSRYMERKQSAAEQEYGSQADMFKTMMGGAFDVMSSKEEGKGKNWLEQWKFEQIPVLNKTISGLTKKQDAGTITAEEELKLQNAIDQKSRIIDIDPVTEAFLKTKDGGYMVTDEMDKLLEEDLKLPKEDKKYKGKRDSQLIVDAIDNVKRRLGMAEGGRVGYEGGGDVMPAAGIMDQGSEAPPEVQNIDYETLRARLPATITDDIVRIIASSAEAMEDFATIQTQQDVNNFNEKYGVELVLPAEA